MPTFVYGVRRVAQAGLVVTVILAGLAANSSAAGAAVIAVSCPTNSLQAAIDNAQSGDTLLVQGTCTGNFKIGKALTLIGRNATLDGNNTGTVVAITTAMVSISNVTITRGFASGDFGFGGGGLVNEAGTVTLNHSRVTANSAASDCFGGGIRTRGGTLTLNSSPVTGNSCPGVGGGIAIDGGTVTLNSSPVTRNTAYDAGGVLNQLGRLALNGSPVSENTAAGLFGVGLAGGIYNNGGDGSDPNDASLTLTNSSVANNTAGVGGGIFGSGRITLTNSHVVGNTARVFEGGGLQVGGITRLRSSVVSGNRAPGAEAVGGGIFNTGTLTVEDSSIVRNTAGVDGGGIWNALGGPTLISRSVVEGNTAGNNGGGIWNSGCCGGGTVILDSSRVWNNVAGSNGGGIYNDAGSVLLRGSVVTGNRPNNCAGTTVSGCFG